MTIISGRQSLVPGAPITALTTYERQRRQLDSRGTTSNSLFVG